MREIIFKKLDIFKDILMQECALKILENYPKALDVENLIEHSIAKSGKFDFVDEAGRDFNDIDNSDSKTGTVNIKTGKAEIGNVEGKMGSIRLTIFNPISPEAVSFLYLPEYYAKSMARECYGQNAGKKRYIITWSKKRPKKYKDSKIGYFNQFEKFRLDSFDELSQMTDEKFYQLNPHLLPNIFSPMPDFVDETKNLPNEQIANPYIEMSEKFEILELPGTQSTFLFE